MLVCWERGMSIALVSAFTPVGSWNPRSSESPAAAAASAIRLFVGLVVALEVVCLELVVMGAPSSEWRTWPSAV